MNVKKESNKAFNPPFKRFFFYKKPVVNEIPYFFKDTSIRTKNSFSLVKPTDIIFC